MNNAKTIKVIYTFISALAGITYMNEIPITARYRTHKVYECPTGKTCIQIQETIKVIYTFISAFVAIIYMNLKKVLQQFKNPAISGSGM